MLHKNYMLGRNPSVYRLQYFYNETRKSCFSITKKTRIKKFEITTLMKKGGGLHVNSCHFLTYSFIIF